ncbi:MAG: acyltransferase [Actinomycetota bacterium]
MDTTTASTPTPTVADLAAQTRSDRNRAVDFYRAVAMIVVALGHWAAIAAFLDDEGDPAAGNALEYAPSMAWVTWALQVMPLFFVVGGYASAVSLDSFTAKGKGNGADWVAGRLRRMLAPTVVLAGFWAALFAVGAVAGVSGLVGMAAAAAAIPLWFLANYTIDTGIAPIVRPRYRARPVATAATLVGVFAVVQVVHLAGVPHVGHINWVIGWLMFQVAGFAWRDGHLPTGRRLVAVAATAWTIVVGLTVMGPFPVSMVHVPGLELSPTHPPSIALVVFGVAHSATALAVAPAITRFLERNRRAWAGVVAANSMAMTIYLWHMTAAIGAVAIVWQIGLLPTAQVGSIAWWVQKLPVFGLSTILLALIVAAVSGVERRSLLSPARTWVGGPFSMAITVVLVSSMLKLWTAGSATSALVGSAAVLVLGRLVLVAPAREERAR